MPDCSRFSDARATRGAYGVLLMMIAGCASVPTRQAGLRARLDALAAQCAAREAAGGPDTTAIYGRGFEADGFVRAAPTPQDRFRLDHPGQEVQVEFVVDTTGHPDLCLGHVIKETEPGLGDRLLDAVSGWSFTPAQYRGKKVRQVVRVVYTALPAK